MMTYILFEKFDPITEAWSPFDSRVPVADLVGKPIGMIVPLPLRARVVDALEMRESMIAKRKARRTSR